MPAVAAPATHVPKRRSAARIPRATRRVIAWRFEPQTRHATGIDVARRTRRIQQMPVLMGAGFRLGADPDRQRGVRIPAGGFQDYGATGRALFGFAGFQLLLEFLRGNTACWRSRTHEKPPLRFYNRRLLNDAVLGIKTVARCGVEDQRLQSRNGIRPDVAISGEP
jgi:hypothetical protein